MGYLLHFVCYVLFDGVLEFAPLITVGEDAYAFDHGGLGVFGDVDYEYEVFVIHFHPVLDACDFYFIVVGEVHVNGRLLCVRCMW